MHVVIIQNAKHEPAGFIEELLKINGISYEYIVSPLIKFPANNSCDRGFIKCFWIVLFKGLAPNVTS